MIHLSNEIQTVKDLISERLVIPVNSASVQRSVPNITSPDKIVIPSGWDTRAKIMAVKEGFPFSEIVSSWRKESHKSIIHLFETTISQHYHDADDLTENGSPGQTKTSTNPESDFQKFLALQHELVESRDDEASKQPPSSIATSVTSEYNIGGIQVEKVEEVLRRIRAREAQTAQNPSTPNKKASDRSESSTPGYSPNNEATSQNEVLASFFQNLLDRRRNSPQNSPG